MQARSRAIYFPTGLESFGYPLAEARVSGQPAIARDTAQNREIAGPALCGYSLGDPDSLRRCRRCRANGERRARPRAVRPGPVFRLVAWAAPMTRLGLRPYQAGDDPPPGSVPVSVVVLTLNEEPNIRRCLASVAWANQEWSWTRARQTARYRLRGRRRRSGGAALAGLLGATRVFAPAAADPA